MRRMAASSAAPRKARKAGRGSDEAANPGRVLFLVYLAIRLRSRYGRREPDTVNRGATFTARRRQGFREGAPLRRTMRLAAWMVGPGEARYRK